MKGLAQALIAAAHGHNPDKIAAAVAAAKTDLKSGRSANLPSALQLDSPVCIATGASLQTILGLGKEAYVRTEQNLYCFAKTDDGKWACYNPRTGRGHYLESEDMSVVVRKSEAMVLKNSGMMTSPVEEVVVARSEMSAVKLEFLTRLQEAKAHNQA